MTETRGDYHVATVQTADDTAEAAVCPNCRTTVGVFVQVGGQVWIRAGGLENYASHGRCAACHRPYHYNESEKRLERIVERQVMSARRECATIERGRMTG